MTLEYKGKTYRNTNEEIKKTLRLSLGGRIDYYVVLDAGKDGEGGTVRIDWQVTDENLWNLTLRKIGLADFQIRSRRIVQVKPVRLEKGKSMKVLLTQETITAS